MHASETLTDPKLRAAIKRKLESIAYVRQNVISHEIMGQDNKPHEFKYITQKFIYSELIYLKSVNHSYEGKWPIEHDDLPLISWKEVWETVHKQFYTEKVKSTVWEQIHLNYYTTYNYNIWHNELHPCPLCHKIPEDVFHILFNCPFVRRMWNKIELLLLQIVPTPLTKYELAFGLYPQTRNELNATILRNWITFSLRHSIMGEERKAFHLERYTEIHEKDFIERFNITMQSEITEKHAQYKFMSLEEKFVSIVEINGIITKDAQDRYKWKDV